MKNLKSFDQLNEELGNESPQIYAEMWGPAEAPTADYKLVWEGPGGESISCDFSAEPGPITDGEDGTASSRFDCVGPATDGGNYAAEAVYKKTKEEEYQIISFIIYPK